MTLLNNKIKRHKFITSKFRILIKLKKKLILFQINKLIIHHQSQLY